MSRYLRFIGMTMLSPIAWWKHMRMQSAGGFFALPSFPSKVSW